MNVPDRLRLFYSNRTLRIFVPYWSVLAITVLASLIAWLTIGNAFNIGPWLTRFTALDAPAQAFLIAENLLISGQDLSLGLIVDAGHQSFIVAPVERWRSGGYANSRELAFKQGAASAKA